MKRGRNVKSKESNRICIEIWNDYEPKLRKICNVKMSNHPDYIDDVMQEVFLALLKKVKNSLPDNPKAWLYAVLTNTINREYRKLYSHQKNIISIDDMQIDLPYENDFSDLYVDHAFLDEFKKTLENELSKDDKEFIYYIYEKRLKMKEIADILDSTESAVKQRHYRLINKIRKMVNKIL